MPAVKEIAAGQEEFETLPEPISDPRIGFDIASDPGGRVDRSDPAKAGVDLEPVGQIHLGSGEELIFRIPAQRSARGKIDSAFGVLDEEFRATGEGPAGVCVLITDREEMRRRPEAVWPGTSFIYAGYTPAGAQVRIAYFEGATIGPGIER